MRSMQSKLMGAPGHWNELNTRVATLYSNLSPVGGAHLTVHLIINLDRAVIHIKAEGQLNDTAVQLQHAIKQCDILLCGEPLMELPGEMPVGSVGQGDHHQTGGIHVQPVHCWLLDTPRKHTPHSVGHAVYFFRTPPGNSQHTTAFVDHNKIPINVQKVQ